MVHAAHVTYFVRDITRFVANLESAARRRVIITLASVAGPMLNAELFKMVYGEEQALVPSYAYLLPVLWEIGILPDVRFLPQATTYDGVPQPPTFPQNKEEAVEMEPTLEEIKKLCEDLTELPGNAQWIQQSSA